MRILITGGYGFIGSNFINYIFTESHVEKIVNLDLMTYAANEDNIIEDRRNHSLYTFVHGDINDRNLLEQIINTYQIDTVVHFAAESHVDRSIQGADKFITTNVNGTFTLVDTLNRMWKDNFEGKRFVHISTDEVFGSLELGDLPFTKNHPYKPNSPYAASKAASDLIVRSYYKTYKFPAIITNCSNNFGPHQHEEKLIPMVIKSIYQNKPIPVYGNGKNVRDWIYVQDHAKCIWKVLLYGKIGEQYLIGGNMEVSNIEVINMICDVIGKGRELITYVEDRKGHDFRYAIDTKDFEKEFGDIFIGYGFKNDLQFTVAWYSRKLGIVRPNNRDH